MASFSDQAVEPGAVTDLTARVRAEEGTVLLVRTDNCPASGVVFLDVARVGDPGSSALPFLCDPNALAGSLADDDDEVIDGEAYVLLGVAGEYDVRLETDALDVTSMNVELFTDPTPTIVRQDELVDAGHEATLTGVGDTIVYDFSGTDGDGVNVAATGLDTACVIEAYGAEPVGRGGPWSLSICGHSETAGSGLGSAGLPVPMVVFSRTDDPIEVTLTLD